MTGGPFERIKWLYALKPGDEVMVRGWRCVIDEIGPRGSGGGRAVVQYNWVRTPDGARVKAYTHDIEPVSDERPQT